METYQFDGTLFKGSAGSQSAYLHIDPKEASVEWETKQSEAQPEYEQELEHFDELIEETYKALENYLAKELLLHPANFMLDIGCGINPNYPKYIEFLNRKNPNLPTVYVGLDPIRHQINQRKYPFICSRIEDVAEVLQTKFDLILLASSLDHFEDLESVSATIQKIASPQARMVVWIGLHDASIVSEQIAAVSYPELFKSHQLIPFLWKMLRFNLQSLIHFKTFRRRNQKLRQGQALDNFHFHYFTEQNILPALAHFGKLVDSFRLPGTNSRFYTIQLASAKSNT